MRAVVSSNPQSEIRIPQSPLTLSQVERAAEGAEVDDGVAGPDRAVEVRAHRLFGWLVLARLFPVRRGRRRPTCAGRGGGRRTGRLAHRRAGGGARGGARGRARRW